MHPSPSNAGLSEAEAEQLLKEAEAGQLASSAQDDWSALDESFWRSHDQSNSSSFKDVFKVHQPRHSMNMGGCALGVQLPAPHPATLPLLPLGPDESLRTCTLLQLLWSSLKASAQHVESLTLETLAFGWWVPVHSPGSTVHQPDMAPAEPAAHRSPASS